MEKKHRLDGPAYINNDGEKEWWKNGKRHRIDGPAVIGQNGSKRWYINGACIHKRKVEPWIKENNIDLKTKQHQALFMLKFG